MGGIKHIMGRSNKKDDHFVSKSQTSINDLNNFYGRFDNVDGKTECDM